MSKGQTAVAKTTVWEGQGDDEAVWIATGSTLCECIQEQLACDGSSSDIKWDAVSALMVQKMAGKRVAGWQWSAVECRQLWDSVAYGVPLSSTAGAARAAEDTSAAYLQPYRAVRRFHLTMDLSLDQERPVRRREEVGGGESADESSGKRSKLRKIVAADEQGGGGKLNCHVDPEDKIVSFARPSTFVVSEIYLKPPKKKSAEHSTVSVTACFGNASFEKRASKKL